MQLNKAITHQHRTAMRVFTPAPNQVLRQGKQPAPRQENE